MASHRDGDAPRTNAAVDRRTLLRASSLAAAVAAAGCTVEIGGFEIEVGENGTPTPTYGYGGSPADSPTGNGATTTGRTTGSGSSPTDTDPPDESTEGPTATSAAPDDYGQQGYGEYEYGG